MINRQLLIAFLLIALALVFASYSFGHIAAANTFAKSLTQMRIMTSGSGGGASSNPCYSSPGRLTCVINTYFNTVQGGGFSGSTFLSGAPTSPTKYVNSTNSNTAPWLLTCPETPVANPSNNIYFYTGQYAGVNNIGGDLCLANSQPLTSYVTLTTDLSQEPAPPGSSICPNSSSASSESDNIITSTSTTYSCGDIYTASVEPLSVENGASTNIYNIGYSPMVDGRIANGFQTFSYIFGPVPSYAQHGIWSWNSKFANFNSLDPYLPQNDVLTESGSYSLGIVETVAMTNAISGELEFSETTSSSCYYSYSYNAITYLNSLYNYQIPFEAVTSYNPLSNTYSYETFNTPILPYFLYGYSLPSYTGSGMYNSYDIFGPWNYYTPMNSIETFPIDTPSRFYVNYNGVFTSSPANSIVGFFTSLLSTAPTTTVCNFPVSTSSAPSCIYEAFVDSGYYSLLNSTQQAAASANPTGWLKSHPYLYGAYPDYFTVSSTITAPTTNTHILMSSNVNGIISIAASPNDYVYVLNYSSSSNNYYITVLRLIPHGYYNTTNYQPSSVGSTADAASWDNEWSSYWANVIEMQDNETYVLDSINLGSIPQLNGFVPLNMSIDDNGDIYMTGYNSMAYNPNTGQTNLPELASISAAGTVTTNTIGVPSYNSAIFHTNSMLPEIATSTDGALVFLANQTDGGYIYVYSTNTFALDNVISLAFQVPATEGSLAGAAALNIAYWLSNNGLFNVSVPVGSYNFSSTTDLDVPEYHHPLALQDVNGYLYVLDNWAGAVDVTWSGGLFGAFSAVDKGAYFDMLMLRVLNSTGYSVPINPSNFNDIYTSYSCGSPTIVTTAGTTVSGNTCEPANTTSSVSCPASSSSSCSVVATRCTLEAGSSYECSRTGQDCPVYGNSYSCATSSGATSYYAMSTQGQLESTYPPYGWILSANVTIAKLTALTVGGFVSPFYAIGNDNYSVSFCNSNTCEYYPQHMPPNYHGTFYPIGPSVTAMNMSEVKGPFGSWVPRASQSATDIKIAFAPYFHNVGFSVNFNGTIDLLFKNYTYQGSWGLFGYFAYVNNNTNHYNDLLFTTMNIENYTKLFGGNSPYTCYTNTSLQGNGAYNCVLLPAVKYMSSPLYTVTDPFKYLENLGSPQFITYPGYLYSTFSGGTGSGSSQSTSSCLTAFVENGVASCVSFNGISTINTASSLLSSLSSVLAPALSRTTLDSVIQGDVLLPYDYAYTLDQYYGTFILTSGPTTVTTCSGSSCSSQTYQCSGSGCECPQQLYYQVPTQSGTIYTDSASSATSNPLSTTVEGGNTYLQYSNLQSYYIPNVSDIGTIIPPWIMFNVETDRNFSTVYVNTTKMQFNSQPYYQQPIYINGSRDIVYSAISSNQLWGSQSYPGYSSISSTVITPVYGTEAFYSNRLVAASGSFGLHYATNRSTNLVTLFEWYRLMAYNNSLRLYLNSTSYTAPGSITGNMLGFHRLVYVYNDKLNNTIVMPLDADIANITSVALNVSTAVNSINPNSTTLYINGTVGYNNGVKYAKLQNGLVYLYYDADLNYVNYNPVQDPVNAVLCAYGSNQIPTSPSVAGPTLMPANCIQSNPIYIGKTANANFITYSPSYNSLGVCGPAPTSLLTPTKLDCNIYGYGANALCSPNAYGSEQYCDPIYSNGTGICTSQMGLMGIVTTNSMGDFSYTTNACGIGYAKVTAVFYGEPGPEPQTINVLPLAYSTNTFDGAAPEPLQVPVWNYTWTPNQTSTSVPIGLAELGYGNVEIFSIVVLIALLVALFMMRRR